MIFKRPQAEPMLALLILPSSDDLTGVGERFPRDEANSLLLLEQALRHFIEEVDLPIVPQTVKRVRLARRLKLYLRRMRKEFHKQRTAHLRHLLLGNQLRGHNVEETMKLNKEFRRVHVGNKDSREV